MVTSRRLAITTMDGVFFDVRNTNKNPYLVMDYSFYPMVGRCMYEEYQVFGESYPFQL